MKRKYLDIYDDARIVAQRHREKGFEAGIDAAINALLAKASQPTQSDAIERALCEANGCVWDLDPDSDSRKQWRRDVETVLTALQEQSK